MCLVIEAPYQPAAANAIPRMPNYRRGTAVPTRVDPGRNSGKMAARSPQLVTFVAS